ncbi:isoform 2 of ankyrin repeat domain-containing protein 50 [Penicillium brevicompactum]
MRKALSKFKSKAHWGHTHDQEKNKDVLVQTPPAPASAPAPAKTTVQVSAPVPVPPPTTEQAPPAIESEHAPTPEKLPAAPVEEAVNDRVIADEKPQPEPIARDLWQDALAQLSPSSRETLKKMGLDQIRSVSADSTIKDLAGVVNDRQEECEKKFWKVSFGGEDIVLRDYTSRIIGWLEKAGDVAIQFAPTQASLAWDIVKNFMEIPVAEGAQMCALLGTTEKVVRIISRGQVYEQVYLSQTPGTSLGDHQRNLESGLLRIYATALELLAESGKLFSQNTARRTLEAIINPGKSVGALAEIAEQEDDLLRDVQVCETKRSSDSDKRVIGMLETFNDPIFRIDKGVNKVLKHLVDSTYQDTGRTPNTGDWLLQHEDFLSWETQKASALFWLQGSAGTGKTYLTSSVVERVRTMLSGSLEVEGLAYFYCNRSESQRGRYEHILQSFVRQLCTPAQRPEKMQSKIKKAYEVARDRGTDFQPEQCMELIQECLDGYGRTTLIIDAMDECDTRSRSKILKGLNSFLVNSKNPVKIFISSRPDSDIRNRLKDSPTIAVSASSNQRDIKLYLETELEEMANDRTFLNTGTVKQTAVERLLERCQGMFQWAALQIKQLMEYPSKLSFMKRLDDLPEGIQAAYDEVWDYIETLDESDKTFAKRALLWTMSTHKPFSSTELLSAIRIDSNGDMLPLENQIDEQGLLSLCKNFLTIDTQSDVWRFTHLSVVEYLETKEGWSHPKVHYHAASACLSYFINTYDRDFAELPPQTFDLDTDKAVESKDIVDADKEVDPADLEESDDGFGRYHPFHIYMRQCWMHHVREADDTKDKNLATLLKKFLGSPEESSSQYRKWFNVLYKDGWFFFKTTRDATWFYETRHFGSASAGDVIHDIFDEKFAIFGVCRMGLENIASEWLDGAKFDVSRVNTRGHSLLALAVMAGSVPICKMLVGSGADVNQRLETNRRFGSALRTAVSLKNTNVVDYRRHQPAG